MSFFLFSSQAYADISRAFHDVTGSLVIKGTSINKRPNTIVGFRGAFVKNHSYVLGAGIYTIIDNIDLSYNVDGNNIEQKITFGYGGFEVEYIGKWNKRIHYTVHTLFGIGAISYDDMNGLLYNPQNDYYHEFYDNNFYKNMGRSPAGDDWLFLFEPSFNVEINVTETLCVTTGLFYRAVAGVELKGLDNSDIGGPGWSFVVKFGGYR